LDLSSKTPSAFLARPCVLAIAVLGGFPTERNLRAAKPDLLLASIRELPDALEQLRE
jgi:hypothetical protein